MSPRVDRRPLRADEPLALDPVAAEAGGVALKVQLRRASARRRFSAALLVLPLFAFLAATFALPIGYMLVKSVHDPETASLLTLTRSAIEDWDGGELPSEAVFAALAGDLRQAHGARTIGLIGKRLNQEIGGTRSVVIATGRALQGREAGPWKQALIEISGIWASRETWSVMKRAVQPVTPLYLLAALDLKQDVDGRIVSAPSEQSIFRTVLGRTLWISVLVAALTLILGYPVAYLLATLPPRTGNLLMILVLLPFWTSILVRATAWVVLLQTYGVLNDIALWLGLFDERVQLIFNRGSTVVAMTYILLPFTLLPIYSVMKTIPSTHLRAARSLGASPAYAFWRVYVPQTVPGIAAGCLLTYILALGYYITPALVGGPNDQMLSYFVAHYTNVELNWGMASALGAVLLALTLVLFFLYNRFVGLDRMRLG